MNESVFISDIHLIHNQEPDKKIIDFIRNCKKYENIFLLGDILDFYFPYKDYFPSNYSRFFDILQEISKHTNIYYIRGNHEIWEDKKLAKQYNINFIKAPFVVDLYGYNVMMMHGDEIFENELRNRNIKRTLLNPCNIQLFSLLPVKIAYKLGKVITNRFRFDDKEEHLAKIASHRIKNNKKYSQYDYIVMGHIHYPYIEKDIGLCITGDLRKTGSYAVISEKGVRGEYI